jgi:hypothetical protein
MNMDEQEIKELIPDSSAPTIRRVPFPALKEGRAFDEQVNVALYERVEALMADLIPPENTENYAHGEGYVFQRVDSSLGIGKFQHKTGVEQIKTESIASNDIEAFLTFMEALAQGFYRQMKQFLFERVGEEAASVGNVAAFHEDKGLAATYLEMLEMIEFGVDKHGKMSFPQLRLSPQMGAKMQAMLQEQGPEYHRRLDDLVEQKTAAALIREQERLAKYKNAGAAE